MSLEKLLIFGLALAVFAAFATWSLGAKSDRETQESSYRTEINKLVEKAE